MKEKNEYDEKESLPKKNYCGKVMEGIKVIKRFLAINFSRRFIGNTGGRLFFQNERRKEKNTTAK